MLDESLRLQLVAQGLGELHEPLLSLCGFAVSERYTLTRLYAVGGQSVLHLVRDANRPERPALARLALLPYHQPAYVSDADIRRARARIEREAEMMRRFDGTALPRLYDLVYGPNPLHPSERGPEIAQREPYLVMELIQGQMLARGVRQLHGSNPPEIERLTRLAIAVACVVTNLNVTLYENGNGYLYTDLNLKNIIVTEVAPVPGVRVLDAGSLIPVMPAEDVQVPVSWEFVLPVYYHAFHEGRHLWPDRGFVAYSLGKVLWAILSGRHPVPAEHPDFTITILGSYPPSVISFVHRLIEDEPNDFVEIRKAAFALYGDRQCTEWDDVDETRQASVHRNRQ